METPFLRHHVPVADTLSPKQESNESNTPKKFIGSGEDVCLEEMREPNGDSTD
jgi:hypothetical protein